jgi:predicted ATPase
MLAGRFGSSRTHLEEVLAIFDESLHRSLVLQAGDDPYINSRAVLGLVLFCLGYPEQALAQSSAAIARARRLAHVPSLVSSLGYGNRLLTLLGGDGLGVQAEELFAVTTEQGFPFFRAQGMIDRGWNKVKHGDIEAGVSLLRSGSTAYRVTGAQAWVPYHTALLAKACGAAGQVQEALTLLDDALQLAGRRGERWLDAELNRQKGELLLRQGHTAIAEDLYQNARKIAHEQHAKLWELRAAASLARLWRDQCRSAEAREVLAPVYGWFTEGFEIADLKEARALLVELQGPRGQSSG